MNQREGHLSDDTASESAESPSKLVVEAVAAAAGTDPNELEPLYDAVNPDALDAIFADPGTSAIHRTGSVEFAYSGFRVVVSRDGAGTNVLVR